jgi:hypothetical protein
MIEVAVLDGYQRLVLSMADWSRLGPECRVTMSTATVRSRRRPRRRSLAST